MITAPVLHPPVAVSGVQGAQQGFVGLLGRSVSGSIASDSGSSPSIIPINQTIIDAQLPEGDSQDAVFSFLVDTSNLNCIVYPTIRIQWGCGGAFFQDELTIRGLGHFTFNVRGSSFRLSVLSGLVYPHSLGPWLFTAGISKGRITYEAPICVLDTILGGVTIGETTSATILFGSGANLSLLSSCIPRLARKIRFRRDVNQGMQVYSGSNNMLLADVSPTVECPWLDIAPEGQQFNLYSSAGTTSGVAVDVTY